MKKKARKFDGGGIREDDLSGRPRLLSPLLWAGRLERSGAGRAPFFLRK